MNKRRLNLQCWYDQRQYTYLVPLDSRAKLIVECPYCRNKASIDLNPFRKPHRETYRGGDEGADSLGERFDFPDVIPTEAVEE